MVWNLSAEQSSWTTVSFLWSIFAILMHRTKTGVSFEAWLEPRALRKHSEPEPRTHCRGLRLSVMQVTFPPSSPIGTLFSGAIPGGTAELF